MTNELASIGNLPISTTTIASLFPEIKAGNQKVRNLELSGKLVRLKKGLYVVSPYVLDGFKPFESSPRNNSSARWAYGKDNSAEVFTSLSHEILKGIYLSF